MQIVEIFDYNDSGDHDFIGEFYTNLEEMAEGEGFQIVTWDVINAKIRAKKGDDYENSGTVILKSINIERVKIAISTVSIVFFKSEFLKNRSRPSVSV